MLDSEMMQIIVMYGVAVGISVWMSYVALKEGNKKGG